MRRPRGTTVSQRASLRWTFIKPKDDIVVESAIAGVRPEDIDIQVTADSITIRGSRRREKEVGDEDYLYQECYWGRFARSIILPQEVDPDGANVTFKNGILTVRLPKVNKKKIQEVESEFGITAVK